MKPNSPCINAGVNFPVTAVDLDGNPRIVGGAEDMGAYEFQYPTSAISYAWLQYYGLPTDGSADYTDPDGDGMNNWKEWICGTDPTNALSVLKLLPPTPNGSGVTLKWLSVTNRTYTLERATNLVGSPLFSVIGRYLAGHAGTTSFPDTNAPPSGAALYRVGIAPSQF